MKEAGAACMALGLTQALENQDVPFPSPGFLIREPDENRQQTISIYSMRIRAVENTFRSTSTFYHLAQVNT